MKIGYPTHPRHDLVEEITWIGQNGFEFVDLFLEPDLGAAERVDVPAVRAALDRFGLGVIGHLAWYLPIGSPLRRLREAAVEEAVRYADTFAAIGVERVTIHANWPPGLFTAEEGIDWQSESLARLIPAARERGITLLFEPVGHGHESEENLGRLFARHPEMAFHLDIGHFNLNHRSPAHFARVFRDRLGHVHLHDNDGTKDQHLPMGTGRVEWEPLLKELKGFYRGTVTLEIFTPVREYVLVSRDLLRRLWAAA